MSLDTPHGKATVVDLCVVFGISRAAYYQARKPRPVKLAVVTDALPSSPAPAASRKGSEVAVAELRAAISSLCVAHPAWGHRKVHASLRRAPYGLRVGRKRVWALMKSMGLCFTPGARPMEYPRGQIVVELPNRRWATDLTTVWTAQDGLVAVVPVIDCGCRSLLALRATKSQESTPVLAPVVDALAAEFGGPAAVPEGLELRTDHGPQYTGEDCHSMSTRWKLDHTFAPVGRPTGNAVAERVIRTMKEECIWLRDWTSLSELQTALDEWRRVYNDERPHQALNWMTPTEARDQHVRGRLAA